MHCIVREINDRRARNEETRGVRGTFSTLSGFGLGCLLYLICAPPGYRQVEFLRGKQNFSGEKKKQGIRRGKTLTLREFFRGEHRFRGLSGKKSFHKTSFTGKFHFLWKCSGQMQHSEVSPVISRNPWYFWISLKRSVLLCKLE